MKTWQVAVLVVLLLALGAATSEIRSLRRDLRRTVNAVTEDDLASLERQLAANNELIASLERQNADFFERLTLLGRTLTRIVSRPTVPGPAGPPGAPGSPGAPFGPPTVGKPLIPPENASAARLGATERLLVKFDPGHLVECAAPDVDPDTVELLRDPSGRVLSTAPCVASIFDEVKLPTEVPRVAERSKWKVVGAVAMGGWGIGAAYEVGKLWVVALDGVVLAYPKPAVGPGLSFGVAANVGAGLAYLYTGEGFSPAVYLTYQP